MYVHKAHVVLKVNYNELKKITYMDTINMNSAFIGKLALITHMYLQPSGMNQELSKLPMITKVAIEYNT